MVSVEFDRAAVVMLGSFNPAIFQPRWLGSLGLIPPEESKNAKITIIQAEVADFSTDWFQLQVLTNRFMVASLDPRQFSPLRDLATGIFTILPHTPISAVGLSRSFHYKMPSKEAWNAIGDLLAPKEHWKTIMDNPGLRAMLMQGRRKELGGGDLHVKVEPSSKVEHGLYVEVNGEFRPTPEESLGIEWVPRCLTEYWDPIMKLSEDTLEHFVRLPK